MTTSQCSTRFTSTSLSSQPSSSQGEATQHLESIRKNAITLFNSISRRKDIDEFDKKMIKCELTKIRQMAASDTQLDTALKACEVSITILRGDLISKIWTSKNKELLHEMYLHSIQATLPQAEENRFESKKRPRPPEPFSQNVELNKLPKVSDVAMPISTTSTPSTNRVGENRLSLIYKQATFLSESIKGKQKRSPEDKERQDNTAHWLEQIIRESYTSSDLAQFVCRCETPIFLLSISLKNKGLWNAEEVTMVMSIMDLYKQKFLERIQFMAVSLRDELIKNKELDKILVDKITSNLNGIIREKIYELDSLVQILKKWRKSVEFLSTTLNMEHLWTDNHKDILRRMMLYYPGMEDPKAHFYTETT